MLIGSYRHSVDAKNRMRMPFKFKSELGEGYIITKGNANNLFVFSKEQFKAVYDKLTAIPLFDSEAQKAARKFLSSAFETEEDAQGRVLLPKELVAYATITKNLVFIGAGNRVEIWAEEVWDKVDGETESFDALSKFGV